MTRPPLALLPCVPLLLLRPALAEPAPLDVHPERGAPWPPAPEVSAGTVELVGEVVVMEGDDETVSTVGSGHGISRAQLQAIANRFYLHYPDEFDGLAIFTSFPDLMQGGAAYSVGPGAGTGGIGYGGYGSEPFGSQGRLVSVINMNDTDNYGSMSESDPHFPSVFGQEFAHSWLAYMTFRDPETGEESFELLGRDGSHWSAVFDSGSSVMDGLTFTDHGDGTFTAGPFASRYGPLDLYAMGILAPEEVGPLYVIRDATYAASGEPVNPVDDGWTGRISQGTVLRGERFDFTIEDVIAQLGERDPAWDEENEDFRVAFILVTRPGESVADVAERADKLNAGRFTWEAKHTEWTMKRSSMCTDVSAPCPLAAAAIGELTVTEASGGADGDGIIEPRERIHVNVVFANEGTEAAVSATGEVASESPGVVLPEPETLPEIPAGGSAEHAFSLEVEGEACGEEIELEVRARIEHRQWKGRVSFRPGVLEGEPDGFESRSGWRVDVAREDTATNGAWGHGVPEATHFAGRTLQPAGGAGGEGDPAWFTDPLGEWNLGEVIGGRTTLTSEPMDLSDTYAPTLRYKVWYLALDRPGATLVPSTEAHLIVEASNDGGESWVEIDRVSGDPLRWAERDAPLPEELSPTEEVRFRFIAIDDAGPDERLVEIGVDDVSILSLSRNCAGASSGGCGCRGGAGHPATGLALGLLFFLAVIRRRR